MSAPSSCHRRLCLTLTHTSEVVWMLQNVFNVSTDKLLLLGSRHLDISAIIFSSRKTEKQEQRSVSGALHG